MENVLKIMKELKEEGFDREDRKEIMGYFLDEECDFEVGNYRFISSAVIDDILKEELLQYEYALGCFSDWFIADVTGLNLDTVQKNQKSKNYELLGALMAKSIDEVVSKYVSSDSYGNHFASYDSDEHELSNGYYFFRIA